MCAVGRSWAAVRRKLDGVGQELGRWKLIVSIGLYTIHDHGTIQILIVSPAVVSRFFPRVMFRIRGFKWFISVIYLALGAILGIFGDILRHPATWNFYLWNFYLFTFDPILLLFNDNFSYNSKAIESL